MDLTIIPLVVILGCAAAWIIRRRYEKGTVQRTVATVVAVVLSLIGLAGVGFIVFFIISFNSWANNK